MQKETRPYKDRCDQSARRQVFQYGVRKRECNDATCMQEKGQLAALPKDGDGLFRLG